LSERFRVSRPTIDKILNRARKQEFSPRNSSNHRFNSIKFGIKRLAKVEGALERKRKAEARRYNKSYPGEMIHFDTKRLPLLKGENNTMPREYLFVAIDDKVNAVGREYALGYYSRELYAAILPDKSQYSAATFLQQVLDECPYTVECAYSDNGTEYKGTDSHAFVSLCRTASIGQKFTRVKRPQTNAKAERVIWTLMEMWHTQISSKVASSVRRAYCAFLMATIPLSLIKALMA